MGVVPFYFQTTRTTSSGSNLDRRAFTYYYNSGSTYSYVVWIHIRHETHACNIRPWELAHLVVAT